MAEKRGQDKVPGTKKKVVNHHRYTNKYAQLRRKDQKRNVQLITYLTEEETTFLKISIEFTD